jgi:metal-sulfur cluster biosynthetic enzyme
MRQIPAAVDVAGTEHEVRRRLAEVEDPCSVAMATPISVVDLGLIRAVTVDASGRVEVVISPTSPGCLVLPRLAEAVHRVTAAVPGVNSVDVTIDTTFEWSEAAMAPTARQALEERRSWAVRDLGLRPRQWKERAADGSAR